MRTIILLVLLAASVGAQSLDTTYEPNATYPFGRPNPKAPAELNQFSFMIGEFDCTDEIINPADGKWVKFKAIWNARYFLNGQGIQDHYWSPAFAASNLRMFDSKSKSWKVTFYRMPGYSPTPAWEGRKEGENMVMRRGDKQNGTSLTFYNISTDGFDWKGENLKDGKASAFWTSSCKRRT